jgi:hypothetical protein
MEEEGRLCDLGRKVQVGGDADADNSDKSRYDPAS